MSDLVTGITTALDIATKLRALNKKVGEAEFKMYLADLSLALGDAKLEAANLKSEVADLRDKLAEAQRQLAQRVAAEPSVDEGCYVFDDSGRHYCTACYDVRHKKVLVTELTGHWKAFGKWKCNACDKTYGPSD